MWKNLGDAVVGNKYDWLYWGHGGGEGHNVLRSAANFKSTCSSDPLVDTHPK